MFVQFGRSFGWKSAARFVKCRHWTVETTNQWFGHVCQKAKPVSRRCANKQWSCQKPSAARTLQCHFGRCNPVRNTHTSIVAKLVELISISIEINYVKKSVVKWSKSTFNVGRRRRRCRVTSSLRATSSATRCATVAHTSAVASVATATVCHVSRYAARRSCARTTNVKGNDYHITATQYIHWYKSI